MARASGFLRNLVIAFLLIVVVAQLAFAAQTLSNVELFDAVWGAVDESYAGPGFKPLEWQATWRELRPLAEKAKDVAATHSVIDRMLSRLNDPHTYYLSPEQMVELRQAKLAEDRLDVVGIGVLLTQAPDGSVVARQVLPKSPAARAGIRQGTRITAVDGHSVKGLPVAAVAQRIRGDKGTKVILSLMDPSNKSRSVTLSRTDVRFVADVRSKVLPDNIGYLYLPGGGDGFELKVLGHLRKLQRTQGLIIDLRSGWSAIDLSHMMPILRIAGLFTDLSLGTLVSRQGTFLLTPQRKWESSSSDSWWRSLLTPPPTAMDVYKKPVAFVVDDSTTWDILAVAMQEIGRAVVVGRPTATGAGALAGGYELVDGSGLSVTITYYSSPKQHTLKDGMRPDVTVPMDLKYLAAWYRGEDPDIGAAKETLLARIAATKASAGR
ncbi:MAG: S41 family peptidase [Limnochordia bacterium]|jgi:carboxyl-terminal processing protease